MDNIVLKVSDLNVFLEHDGHVEKHLVRDLSFSVKRGECLCIVGESGSGKSISVQAIMGLLDYPLKYQSKEILINNKNLKGLSYNSKLDIVGMDISMIFQDPLSALNPVMTIGKQIEEVLILHTAMNRKARKARVIELLDLVRIPDAESRMKQYPHQLSGGMRQRIMIAIALACNPSILIADEPTTALDVTTQSQILNFIKELQNYFDMATILITHDLGVVSQMGDKVLVMYGGECVEYGTVEDIFYNTAHPYTAMLKSSAIFLHGQENAINENEKFEGYMPNSGCKYYPRCSHAMEVCKKYEPPLYNENGRLSRCWLHHDLGINYLDKSNIKSLKESKYEKK